MIEITNQHIKNGKLDREALSEFGVDAVKFDGDNIIFNSNVDFWRCESLIFIENAIFNGDVWIAYCDSLMSIKRTVFKSKVSFYENKNLILLKRIYS